MDHYMDFNAESVLSILETHEELENVNYEEALNEIYENESLIMEQSNALELGSSIYKQLENITTEGVVGAVADGIRKLIAGFLDFISGIIKWIAEKIIKFFKFVMAKVSKPKMTKAAEDIKKNVPEDWSPETVDKYNENISNNDRLFNNLEKITKSNEKDNSENYEIVDDNEKNAPNMTGLYNKATKMASAFNSMDDNFKNFDESFKTMQDNHKKRTVLLGRLNEIHSKKFQMVWSTVDNPEQTQEYMKLDEESRKINKELDMLWNSSGMTTHEDTGTRVSPSDPDYEFISKLSIKPKHLVIGALCIPIEQIADTSHLDKTLETLKKQHKEFSTLLKDQNINSATGKYIHETVIELRRRISETTKLISMRTKIVSTYYSMYRAVA